MLFTKIRVMKVAKIQMERPKKLNSENLKESAEEGKIVQTQMSQAAVILANIFQTNFVAFI